MDPNVRRPGADRQTFNFSHKFSQHCNTCVLYFLRDCVDSYAVTPDLFHFKGESFYPDFFSPNFVHDPSTLRLLAVDRQNSIVGSKPVFVGLAFCRQICLKQAVLFYSPISPKAIKTAIARNKFIKGPPKAIIILGPVF